MDLICHTTFTMFNKLKLLSLTLLLILSFEIKAQKQIEEGRAIYSAAYDIPADKLQNYGLLPSEIIIYFRGDSTAAIVNQGDAIIKGVSVLKENYHSMIIDFPAFAKKIFVLESNAEVEDDKKDIPEFTAKKESEKEQINGYHCEKVTLTDKKSGSTYELWITNDISIIPNTVSRPVSTFGGVPVKFVTFNHGILIKAELIQVDESPVPSGFFSATKDYEKRTLPELKKFTSGGN